MDPVTIMLGITAATSLMSASAQTRAGKLAAEQGRMGAEDAELSARTNELAATQRETERKQQLASALATANAQAGASGIRAFEGSPLTILQQSIENEETATERDMFNTRISALTQRRRGQMGIIEGANKERLGRLGGATSLLKAGASVAAMAAPSPTKTGDFQGGGSGIPSFDAGGYA